MIIRSCYKRIGNYVIGAFVGGLGLFNATKLETRYASDSNAELFCQNGQIIFSALMLVCYAGILGEFFVIRNMKKNSHNNILKIEKYVKFPKEGKAEELIDENKKDQKIKTTFDPVPQDRPKFKNRKKGDKKNLKELVPKRKKYRKKKIKISPKSFSDPVNADERDADDNYKGINNKS